MFSLSNVYYIHLYWRCSALVVYVFIRHNIDISNNNNNNNNNDNNNNYYYYNNNNIKVSIILIFIRGGSGVSTVGALCRLYRSLVVVGGKGIIFDSLTILFLVNY